MAAAPAPPPPLHSIAGHTRIGDTGNATAADPASSPRPYTGHGCKLRNMQQSRPPHVPASPVPVSTDRAAAAEPDLDGSRRAAVSSRDPSPRRSPDRSQASNPPPRSQYLPDHLQNGRTDHRPAGASCVGGLHRRRHGPPSATGPPKPQPTPPGARTGEVDLSRRRHDAANRGSPQWISRQPLVALRLWILNSEAEEPSARTKNLQLRRVGELTQVLGRVAEQFAIEQITT
jgi:hypothetical protein